MSYTVCPGCGFDVNNGVPECWYCRHGKTRTTAALKLLLAEAEVLLRSAQRINDAAATAYYSRQLARCRKALDAPEGQGELFK